MQQYNDKTIKVILTGGGTAGHVWPLISVWQELKSYSYKYKFDFLFVGSKNGPEKKLIQTQGIKYAGINSGKLRRYFSFENFIDPFKVIGGFFASIKIISSFKPDVIFAKGGYVTLPLVLAAKMCKIPIIIHESDIVMGLANSIEAKLANKVCVGWPAQFYNNIPINKIVYTGNPIRKEFSKFLLTSYTLSHKPVILITGGSQGAHFINEIISKIINELVKKYHLIHVCGQKDYEWLKKYENDNYKLYNFTDKMPELMAKSDLIISRSGANTLAEISSLAKPSILIPLPSAANNHQVKNAEIYAKKNAAIVLQQNSLNPNNLLDIINNLMSDKKLLEAMSAQTKSLFHPDSSEEIAEEILKII